MSFTIQKNLEKEAETFQSLQKDVSLLKTLFVDLHEIVNSQKQQLESLEDHISSAKQDVYTAKEDLVIANKTLNTGVLASVSNMKSGILGASLGALVYLYNPYVAIGTAILGGYAGWSMSHAILSHQADKAEE